jgi:DNA topoisomerase-1
MKLLIVESPGKVKKIQGFLGSDWKVAASVGHVRDLPEHELGVSLPDFKPEYAPTERGKDVLKRLAALVKTADEVFLATDPDREGEAIAWHLQDALKLRNPRRVTYGSITAEVVKAAVKAPRTLDMALVKAQEARRVLDRCCGYVRCVSW